MKLIIALIITFIGNMAMGNLVPDIIRDQEVDVKSHRTILNEVRGKSFDVKLRIDKGGNVVQILKLEDSRIEPLVKDLKFTPLPDMEYATLVLPLRIN